MKLKTLAIVVAVLAAAAVAVPWWRQRAQRTPVDPRVGQTLLEAATLQSATTVHLHADGKDVTLVNTAPGGSSWIVREYHDLPADFTKLSRFADSLREAKVVGFASANPERIARMDFGDTRIELLDKDGKNLWTVALGKTAESGLRFVKLGDEPRAYRATFNAWLDSTAKNWADAALVPAKPERVTALEIDFPDNGGTLRLVRDNATAPWKADGLAAGETLKDSEVSSLLTKLTGLRFTETTEPAAPDAVAARENARTFRLTTAEGRTYTIALGRRPAPPAPPPAPAATSATGSAAAAGSQGSAPVVTPPPTPPAPPPSGPVYAFVRSSASDDPINGMMDKLGFQITEWTYTGLPANRAALVNPPASAAPAPSSTPAPVAPPASETPSSVSAPSAESAPPASPAPEATPAAPGN